MGLMQRAVTMRKYFSSQNPRILKAMIQAIKDDRGNILKGGEISLPDTSYNELVRLGYYHETKREAERRLEERRHRERRLEGTDILSKLN
ncbi:MAG: hypothetical protein KAU17_04465 [Spirochaetales bacterium]|nr:hypothetical protein [Spirochaetales bacterium]